MQTLPKAPRKEITNNSWKILIIDSVDWYHRVHNRLWNLFTVTHSCHVAAPIKVSKIVNQCVTGCHTFCMPCKRSTCYSSKISWACLCLHVARSRVILDDNANVVNVAMSLTSANKIMEILIVFTIALCICMWQCVSSWYFQTVYCPRYIVKQSKIVVIICQFRSK